MYFIVDSSANPLICFAVGENNQYQFSHEATRLNENFVVLTICHFASFVMLTGIKLIDATDIDAHFTVIINLCTVPMYQYCIL